MKKLLILLILSPTLISDEIVQKFKNPSFSGQGTSAHYLTIENQEKSRKEKIQDDIEAALKAELRAGENTTLAKFVRNLESRIYAQLSKQLVDSMFGNEENNYTGSFTLEGNTISYTRGQQCDEDGICVEAIIMTIQDGDGSSTEIVIPIGTGGF